LTLDETLRSLNREELKKISKSDKVGMGCPFNHDYDGPKRKAGRPTKRPIEDHEDDLCRELCGELFPKIKSTSLCPCFYYEQDEVKRKFWEAFNRAREGVCYVKRGSIQ